MHSSYFPLVLLLAILVVLDGATFDAQKWFIGGFSQTCTEACSSRGLAPDTAQQATLTTQANMDAVAARNGQYCLKYFRQANALIETYGGRGCWYIGDTLDPAWATARSDAWNNRPCACSSSSSSGSAPAPAPALGCYDAYTPSFPWCSGYVNCGYTCVGNYCGYAGTSCKCSCSSCASFHATLVLDAAQGKCVAPASSILAGGDVSFAFTGARQTYALPAGTTTLQIDTCGAQGSNSGGLGGFVRSTVPVGRATGSTTLFVYVGGAGGDSNYGSGSAAFNGGGVVTLWGNGGGSSDIRTSDGGVDGKTSSSWSSRLVVAGGGGAAYQSSAGGSGGGLTGGAGATSKGGLGGTQTAGGGLQPGDQCAGSSGTSSGSFFSGGACYDGAGGGGGWFGGGSGYTTGGGGSSYTSPSGFLLVNNQGDAQCTGNGALFLTAFAPASLPASYYPSGAGVPLSQGTLVGVFNLPSYYTVSFDLYPNRDCPQCDYKQVLHMALLPSASSSSQVPYRLPSVQFCSALYQAACPSSNGLFVEYLASGTGDAEQTIMFTTQGLPAAQWTTVTLTMDLVTNRFSLAVSGALSLPTQTVPLVRPPAQQTWQSAQLFAANPSFHPVGDASIRNLAVSLPQVSALPASYFPSGAVLAASNLVGVVALPSAYTVSFDLYPTASGSTTRNVMHLNANGNAAGAGSCLPALYFIASTVPYLSYISSGAGINNERVLRGGPALPLNAWATFLITVDSSALVLTMTTAGSDASSQSGAFVAPSQQATWPQVFVYASDPFWPTAAASIRNLQITTAVTAAPTKVPTLAPSPSPSPPPTPAPNAQLCTTGSFSPTGKSPCTPCSPGFYAASRGQTDCTSAPAGSFAASSSGSGATSSTLCPIGTSSAAAAASVCTFCPFGYYSPMTGQSSCTQAPAGSFACTSTAATKDGGPTSLGATGICTCPGGSSSGPGSSCSLCGAGFYSPASGQSQGVCTTAPAGTFASTGGVGVRTGATGTTFCSAGTYSAQGSTACSACILGTYAASTGQSQCLLIPAGSKASSSSSSSRSGTGASAIAPCPMGSYSSAGWSDCQPCASGSYSPVSGSSACTTASAGTFASAGGVGVSSGATGTSFCPTGTISNAGSSACTTCQSGWWTTSASGQTSCSQQPNPTLAPAAPPTPAPSDTAATPTLQPSSAIIALAMTVKFAGITPALIASDSDGSIASKLQISVANALGITTQWITGRATITSPQWTFVYGASSAEQRARATERSLEEVTAQASFGVRAFPTDIVGGASQTQVAATLTQAKAAIASAVQSASACQAAGVSVTFLGAQASNPTPTFGPTLAPAFAPSVASLTNSLSIPAIVGGVVGGVGAFLLLCFVWRVMNKARGYSPPQQNDPVKTIGEYVGDPHDVVVHVDIIPPQPSAPNHPEEGYSICQPDLDAWRDSPMPQEDDSPRGHASCSGGCGKEVDVRHGATCLAGHFFCGKKQRGLARGAESCFDALVAQQTGEAHRKEFSARRGKIVCRLCLPREEAFRSQAVAEHCSEATSDRYFNLRNERDADARVQEAITRERQLAAEEKSRATQQLRQAEASAEAAKQKADAATRAKAAAEQQASRAEDATMCAVCLASPRCVLFQPCRHVHVCEECSEQLRQCPICRLDITKKEKVFL